MVNVLQQDWLGNIGYDKLADWSGLPLNKPDVFQLGIYTLNYVF
jgi:hypothetical protein